MAGRKLRGRRRAEAGDLVGNRAAAAREEVQGLRAMGEWL